MQAVAVGIFLVIYALIIAERWPRTLVALGGGLLLIWTGVLDQHRAFEAIDLNVIFLLAGMMIIADVTGRSGVFQWTAIQSARLARGEPTRILILLGLITASASALLDNVTTVLLIVPVTLSLCATLEISPAPFLITQVMASNIGGTATLIGDPPNILIGSAAGLSFTAFLLNLAPLVLFLLVLGSAAAWLYFRSRLTVDPVARSRVLALDPGDQIKDPQLLRRALIVLSLTLIGFVLHGALGLEPATIALSGAVVLLLWTGYPVREALLAIEWNTLFFFVGLFILVEGLVITGAIERLSRLALDQTGGNVPLTAMLILFGSGVASAIVDNVPYTATMIPFVQELGAAMPEHLTTLWWALALGACLGGNATIIGASANIVVLNIADATGHRISFGRFLLFGLPVTLGSLIIAAVYIWLRYLL